MVALGAHILHPERPSTRQDEFAVSPCLVDGRSGCPYVNQDQKATGEGERNFMKNHVFFIKSPDWGWGGCEGFRSDFPSKKWVPNN